MSLLHRAAVAIRRRQPYIDFANSFDDAAGLPVELANRRAIYLVPVAEGEQSVEEVLDEWWKDIFEEELAGWMTREEDWPGDRTREMFAAWFEAEITDDVVDLTPDEPLTDTDVELANLADAFRTCAWCERDLEQGEGRYTALKVEDRARLEHREGLVLDLVVGDDQVVRGIVTPSDSDEARTGDDVVFRVCSRACERPLRKLVPAALRRALQAIADVSE
jgi:ribosomal protein L24E